MSALKQENQVRLAAALVAVPSLAAAMILLWSGPYERSTQWGLTIVLALLWLWAVAEVHRRVVYPLRTVSNMLGALRERDFSMRARGARSDDAMGEVLTEVNSLARLLREQRLSAMETSALLRQIMSEIDVAVLAFDEHRKLRMVNGHAEGLLGMSTEAAIGRTASELGLGELFEGATPRVLDRAFGGRAGRWELRRGTFLEGGLPRQLVILSDLTRTLREEERQAWQRLVHVLRHEVNNSLTPICSLAESMAGLLDKPASSDSTQDLREGLSIIAERSRGLTRFMTAYSQLTRLPPPKLAPVDVGECVRRVAGLETRTRVVVSPGQPITLPADGDQLQQLLVNLIRNAAEAAIETGGGVTVGWGVISSDPRFCEIWIEDEGPGISNPANLFVPFYTTKPNGSGIGLALARQIAEGHGGTVTLESRKDARGSRASCRLLLQVSDSGHLRPTSEHPPAARTAFPGQP